MLWLIVTLLSLSAIGFAVVRFKRDRSRIAIPVLAVAIPLLVVSLYQFSADKPAALPKQPDLAGLTLEEVTASPNVLARVKELRLRLKTEPENGPMWLALAHALHDLEDIDGAVEAYRQALEHGNRNADVYVRYARALADQQEGMPGEPHEMAKKALALDPNHKDALWFIAGAAYEERDLKQAIAYWERLKKLLPADSEQAKAAERNIQLTREEMMAMKEASNAAKPTTRAMKKDPK